MEILKTNPLVSNWGEDAGKGFSNSLQSVLGTLAQQKMQQYAQKQAQQQQHDLLEKTLGSGWGQLAFLPEKYGLMAMQGGWNPATPQPGMQQNLEALAPEGQAAAPTSPAGLQGPSTTSDLGQAIQQGAYNTPQMKQARELQAQQQAFTAGENVKKREFTGAEALRKEEKEERKFFHGEGKKLYEKLQDEAASAGKMQFEIDKMGDLVRSGQLPSAEYTNFVERLGSGILGNFINPNTLIGKSGEEYNKLAATLMTGAKDIFGSRVTNFDMAQFLKMMPTLMNTDAGKLEIIRDLSILNQMKIEHARMADEIGRENKGYLPSDFRTKLYNRFEPRRKEFAAEFRKQIYRTGSKIQGLPDPKIWPADKAIQDNKGRKLHVVNGEWKELK